MNGGEEIIYTPREAAAYIKVGRSTLPGLMERGLPFLDYGTGPKGNRMIRFRKSDLDRWLESRSVVTPQAQQHPWQKFRRAPGNGA